MRFELLLVLLVSFLSTIRSQNSTENGTLDEEQDEWTSYGGGHKLVFHDTIRRRCSDVTYDFGGLWSRLMKTHEIDYELHGPEQYERELAISIRDYVQEQVFDALKNFSTGRPMMSEAVVYEQFNTFVTRTQLNGTDDNLLSRTTHSFKTVLILSTQFLRSLTDNSTTLGLDMRKFSIAHPDEVFIRSDFTNFTFHENNVIRARGCLFSVPRRDVYVGYSTFAGFYNKSAVSSLDSTIGNLNSIVRKRAGNETETEKMTKQSTKAHVVSIHSQFLEDQQLDKVPDFVAERNNSLLFIDGASCTRPSIGPLRFIFGHLGLTDVHQDEDHYLQAIECPQSAIMRVVHYEPARNCSFDDTSFPLVHKFELVCPLFNETLIMNERHEFNLNTASRKLIADGIFDEMTRRIFDGVVEWSESDSTKVDQSALATCQCDESDGYTISMCVIGTLLFLSLLGNVLIVIYNFGGKERIEEYGGQYLDSRINFVRFANSPDH